MEMTAKFCRTHPKTHLVTSSEAGSPSTAAACMDQQHLRKILRIFGARQQGSEKERAPEPGQSARCLHQGISSGKGSVVTTPHRLPGLLNNLRGIFCSKGLSGVNFLSGLSKEQDHQPWGQDFHRRAPPSAWGPAGQGGTEGRSGRLREARGQI